MESRNGKTDEGYYEIDDTYAEIDDTYAEIDDTYAEINDVYEEIDPIALDISANKVAWTTSSRNRPENPYMSSMSVKGTMDDYEEIDHPEDESSGFPDCLHYFASLGHLLRRTKMGDWSPKFKATVACFVIWVVMILILCVVLSLSNSSDHSGRMAASYCKPGQNCSCLRGMEPNLNQTSCVDINECEKENGGCGLNCVNSEGGFHCTCSQGSTLLFTDNRTCVDIDECREKTDNCEQVCVNSEEGFSCMCFPGFTLSSKDSKTCIDNNECEEGNSGCEHYCVNEKGGFHCTCPHGYTLRSDDNRTCIDINECREKTDDCEQICVNSEGGFLCTCSPGFTLSSSDYKTCIDINECEEDNGGCDHYCVNSLGRFHCTCAHGFVLSSDSKSCELSNIEDGKLLVLTGSTVAARPLSSSNPDDFKTVADFTSQKGKLYYMDFNPRNRKFYADSYSYTEATTASSDKVLECKYGETPICLMENLRDVKSLAVDWLTGNIYLSDYKSVDSELSVCTHNGKFCSRILGSRGPKRSIALDPIGGRLFFTERNGGKSTIWKSEMDGSDAVNIVPDTDYATALSFDSIRNDLYWIDDKTDHIECFNLITHKRFKIVRISGDNLDLIFYDHHLYWSDWATRKVGILDVRKPHDIKNMSFSSPPRSLSIFHPSLSTRSFPNPCESSPCSHICVPKPSKSADPTYACLCPNGYEFKDYSSSSCIPLTTYRDEQDPRICAEKLAKLCSEEQNPCENGGSCNAKDTTHPCSCKRGFTGLYCEVRLH